MKNEPIAVIRAVVVLLTLGAGFLGVQITEDEQGMITENALAIFGSSWALFEVVAAIYARSKVSPVATAKASRITPVSIVMLVSLALGGCGGGYLTPARGPSQKLAASPELSEYCEKIDRKVFRATVATYIGAGLAGGAVVPALVADDVGWLYAGAATGAVGAITGLVATPIKVQSEKRFQERCQ